MEFAFKHAKLSDAERLWLTEILKLYFSKIDLKSFKVKLWKNLRLFIFRNRGGWYFGLFGGGLFG